VIGIPQTKVQESVFDANDRTKSGRVITAFFPDFTLVACYLPSLGGKAQKNRDYKSAYEKEVGKYLRTIDSILPIIFCGDLNDVPNKKSSYFKKEIIPIRDFVDAWELKNKIQPSPEKKQKKAKGEGDRGSTFYYKDELVRSNLQMVESLDRGESNGVRYAQSSFLLLAWITSTLIHAL
jgi:exonuclease III